MKIKLKRKKPKIGAKTKLQMLLYMILTTTFFTAIALGMNSAFSREEVDTTAKMLEELMDSLPFPSEGDTNNIGRLRSDNDPAGENSYESCPDNNPAGEDSYESCPYYSEKNLERYIAYQVTNPDLGEYDVIWHVNAGLDFSFYDGVNEVDGEYPLLVNKHNKLPDGYVPKELVEGYNGQLMTPGTAYAFKRMRADAAQKSIYIDVPNAYRSFDKQKSLFERTVSEVGIDSAETTVARPGFSEHNTGRALDIIGSSDTLEDFDQTPEYEWLSEHCADYGFIMRYSKGTSDITGFEYEPWHITFVGKNIAQGIKEKNIMTLEEYVAKGFASLDDEPIDDRLAVVIDAGHGGLDSGADAVLWDETIEEKDINLDIAMHLKQYLEDEDIRIIMTRDTDKFVTTADRVSIGNSAKASAFISIHQNDTDESYVKGIQTWYDSSNTDSDRMAGIIHKKMLSGLGAEDDGLQVSSDLVVLRDTTIPAVLAETGYMSNTSDLKAMVDPYWRQKTAKSLADGIISFLGIKTIYLTFDDGPSPVNTPEVLDILKARDVKATFFIIAQNAEDYPDIIKRIVAEGHALGVHCYNHDYEVIYESVESYLEDFYKAQNVIYDITGLRPVIYRFPGGSINAFNKNVYKQIISEMDKRGFIYFDWNVSIEDSRKNVKAEDLAKNAILESNNQNYIILLAHDAYRTVTLALNEILDIFSDYNIEIITDNTKPVHL